MVIIHFHSCFAPHSTHGKRKLELFTLSVQEIILADRILVVKSLKNKKYGYFIDKSRGKEKENKKIWLSAP